MISLLTIILILLCLGWTVEAAKSDNHLRRQRELKSPIQYYLQNDEDRSPKRKGPSRSRIGTFGKEDPFFSPRDNIGPFEEETMESGSEEAPIRARMATPNASSSTLEPSYNFSTMYNSSEHAVLPVYGDYELTKSPAPTQSPTNNNLTPTNTDANETVVVVVISKAEEAPAANAQQAGLDIVAGITQNLAKGGKKGNAKGVKGATSTGTSQEEGVLAAQGAPTKTTTGGKTTSNKVKGLSKNKSQEGSAASFWNFDEDDARGTTGKSQKSVKGGTKKSNKSTVESAFGAAEGTGKLGAGKKAKGKSKGSAAAATGTATAPEEPSVVSSVFEEPAPQPLGSTQPPQPPSPPAPTTSPTLPPPVVSSAVSEGPEYPPARGGAENGMLEVDCDAIRQGTATNQPEAHKLYFLATADWILAEGAEFDKVAVGVQRYLQQEVAPALAGCKDRRRRLQFLSPAALVTNVLFDTPTSPGEGSCVIDQVDRCFATETDVDMFFHGVNANVGMRLLKYLNAATYKVNGFLGVVNLRVFDSNGNQVGASGSTNLGNASGNQNENGNNNNNSNNQNDGTGQVDRVVADENDEGVSKWSYTLIGVSAATAFLGTIVFCIACQRCRSRDEEEEEVKQVYDFESLPSEQVNPDLLVIRGSGKGGTQEIGPSRTWPDNDDQSSSSDDDIVLNRTNQAAPIEIQVTNKAGDTHQCISSYCEVCAQNSPRVQFIASAHPQAAQDSEVPEDATRNYFVDDTVAL